MFSCVALIISHIHTVYSPAFMIMFKSFGTFSSDVGIHIAAALGGLRSSAYEQ